MNQVSLALVDMAKYDFGPPKSVKIIIKLFISLNIWIPITPLKQCKNTKVGSYRYGGFSIKRI